MVSYVRYPDSFWNAPDFYGQNEWGVKTEEAGWISLLFFSFFGITFTLGLIKIKRVTNKVLSIIGLSLTALFLLWDLVMLSASENLSFDEVGIGFFFFVPVITAFSIVGIVQSTRYKRQGASTKQIRGSDLLDS
ncbi:hypothetical protein Fluta_0190 [Fluviicola taffensis DSM 16823]|uniref:Uncharacterized protein n=2 Tax=Fluviicola TaxID=332102 RepID=F2IBX1_FLUTR|nr:hypothetical protein Fluta_0190 [Fluviicola taffensis DSM 16823]